MAAPGQLNLEPIVRGDTWDGIPKIVFEINGSPPPNDLAFVRMQFRQEPESNPAGASLDSDGNGIVINDAATWDITISPTKLGLTAGKWLWDVETTDSTGEVKTYLAGTIEVLPDISRPRRCN